MMLRFWKDWHADRSNFDWRRIDKDGYREQRELGSGSFTPFESMPEFLQDIMYVSPETHFVRFAQSVLYRGAGVDVIWHDLAIMGALGFVFFVVALSRFRAMLARQS